MSQIKIGGVPFLVINYDDAIEIFQQWIDTQTSNQVCIVNVHTLVTAMRDLDYRAIMLEAGLNTMDGQPLKWYANAVCQAGLSERVCGPELMLQSLEKGVERKWKHYFLGGRPEVLNTLESKVIERFSGVKIVGCYSPPFRPATENEEAEIVKRINESKADVLWVGLGAPRQEQWIYRNLHRLTVPVCIGVGAAFDFHAGSVARAPSWMQKSGLEWLYRVGADPRLFRRYLDTNPPFIWMLIRDWFMVRVVKRNRVC